VLIATSVGVVGLISLSVGAVLTLVAIGKQGRRQFLATFVTATFAVGLYEFWFSDWAAHFGDVATACANAGYDASARAHVERLPPRLHCYDRGIDVFVPPDAVAWVALAGSSLFYGFTTSFPLVALILAIRKRSVAKRQVMLG
jgi:hypothetical protein